MALIFADTHNMVTFLTKSDANDGFEQIIDFLNTSVIQYALMVNLTIYVSCVKQFWSSVSLKKTNDVVRLQALIDRRKVIITEDTFRQALRLDDADSIDYLPNEEIFVKLARMGVGKGLSGVDTLLFNGMLVPQQVHDDVAENEDAANEISVELTPPSPSLATTPPPQQELIPSPSQVESTLPPSPHQSPIAQPSLPPPQQPSQLEDISHSSMALINQLLGTCATLTKKVGTLEQDKIAQAIEITKLKQRVKRLEKKRKLKASGFKRLRKVGTAQRVESSVDTFMDDHENASKQGEIAELDANEDITLETVDVQWRLPEYQAQASAPKRIRGVIIQDTDEAATPSEIVQSEVQSKDKGKGIIVEEPKPLKRQAQIKQNEAFARELEAELNANINWNDVIEQVERKERQDNTVMRYQALKRKRVTEAQARKNMMVYLKNMAGFKMDFFKERKKEIEEEESKERKKKSENLDQKAAKKQKIDEETEEHKTHLQIVPNDEDDVYTEATPLALKMILLVKRRYLLTRFTLKQMLNNVRLEVEEESDMSLELLSFGVDAVEDFKEYMLRDYYCWLKTYCCWFWLKLLDNTAGSS
uniref:Xylulose kinase-1 n=1 Tax=Tanacetum cinerariifolium TaxID=118510 RepID=A0A699GMH8_TANCI|nr:hypothetical protein [Tanacetum cinerariifolium]